jgi:hypothetical protein
VVLNNKKYFTPLLDDDDDDDVNINNNKNLADWFSSNALDTNSGDNRFESRTGHKLSSQLPHDLAPSFQANTGIVALTQSGHDRFLPNPFQSLIHLSSCSQAGDSVIKYTKITTVMKHRAVW